MTMVLGTMSHRSAGLAVSLDSALESFSLGNSSCINLVACSEDISFNLIFYRILFCIVETEFSNKSLISDTSLVKVSLNRLADQFLSLVNKTNLYGLVAIVLFSLNLGYYAGTCLKNSYRN